MIILNNSNNIKNSQKTIDELGKSSIPLYIWGAGNVADEVYRVLRDHNIEVNGVFVNGIISKKMKFNNYIVTTLEEALEKNEEINVIMGHAQYHKIAEIEDIQGVHKVYYLLNPFRTHDDISYDYYLEHKAEYEQAYDLFEEEYSRKVFEAYLNTRINDDLQYLLEQFKEPITYFKNDIFQMSQAETYVDIGAYNGDTISEFMESINEQYEHIYAFEPDEKLFSELENYTRENKYENINLYRLGLWNSNEELYFISDFGQSDRVVTSGDSRNKIEVVKLDSILEGRKVSVIKSNLSAATVEWIEGARNILSNQKPKLVISVGLTKQLLYAVPILLHDINKEYKFFLRFNESMPSRLFLYAY